MKIILRKDFETLGIAGEIKEVKAGYARNYLIPNGIAKAATTSNIKDFEEIRRQQSRKIQKETDNAKKVSEKLENMSLTIKMKTGEEDKVFGSVTSQIILEQLMEKGFEGIEKRKILLKEPIKTLGEHVVEVKLHTNVVAKLKVDVVKETEEVSEIADGEETPS
jgi:large subunit ribosomal protein L9